MQSQEWREVHQQALAGTVSRADDDPFERADGTKGRSVPENYMSDYTADIIAHRGILQDGVNFISKPASRNALATKVRGGILDDVNPVPVAPAPP